eukprot:CAMPEP_0201693038 /NCGR_PEP_ID=MMETSP0578-20130828/5752_1 /ASSEMBLY_ACC=CAM_ASM_000663 /TAXON_ID=267565 /ORGANISM="Skeletonema grethea, Strain CCMP 1804" /LENGTH=329 /DNA_ID=CAMNT_0048178499 /DNA_START=268 /DNA_END=1257 /DNA_ORIENTATION=+
MDTPATIRRRRTPHHSSSNSNSSIKSWMLIVLGSTTIFMFGIFITLISQHKKQLKTSAGSLYTKTTTSKNNNINNLSNTAATAACPHGEERTWHGGHPAQDHPGSCWCGQDEYCMCTPSVAIDIVLYQKRPRSAAKNDGRTNPSGTGAEDNYDVWVVRRSDTNQLATIGGFVDTGETTENAVLREVQEETGISIPPQLMSSHSRSSGGGDGGGAFPKKKNSAIKLIGVYSDPRRDNRRHIVSIAYALEFIPDIMTTNDGSGIPHAGDDAKDVIAIPLEEIGVKYVGEDWYADHLSILLDFKMQIMAMKDGEVDRSRELYGGDVARSTCS